MASWQLLYGFGAVTGFVVALLLVLGELSRSRTIIAMMTSEVMSLRYDVNRLTNELAKNGLVEPPEDEDEWELDEP